MAPDTNGYAPETVALTITLNGQERTAEVEPRALLVEAVRGPFEATGTHIGCLTGDCGACTVRMDGRIVKSCMVLAQSAEGAEIQTIEGFAGDAELHPIQQAFWDEYGFQCGYCLPAMLFAAQELLASVPEPDDAQIRKALDGNLCRCTGYTFIVAAIRAAAAGASPGVERA